MAFEDLEINEKNPKSTAPAASSAMTLQKAIDLGEYKPEFLETFAEWATLSPHVQLQYIRQAIENRRKHLLTQWAEVNNVLDFRLKPEMKKTLTRIEEQMRTLEADREKIYAEYSSKA